MKGFNNYIAKDIIGDWNETSFPKILVPSDVNSNLLNKDQLIKVTGLLEKLIQKTKDGKVDWTCHNSSSGREFTYKWKGPLFEVILVQITAVDEDAHSLSIKNKGGQEIGTFWGSKGDSVDNKAVVYLNTILYNKYAKDIIQQKHQAFDDIMISLDELDDSSFGEEDYRFTLEDIIEEVEAPRVNFINTPPKPYKKKTNWFMRLFTAKKKPNER